MPTSLPLPSDLPPSLRPILRPPSPNLKDISNIVIFLPGLGDTSTNFSSFASALNLPSTLTLTLQPPIPIPFPNSGTHWSDTLTMDTSTGTLDSTTGPFTTSTTLLANLIQNTLIKTCSFHPREIHLLGSGQGAVIALATALHPSLYDLELGGVVAIGGLPPLYLTPNQTPNRTPVLLLGGSRGVLTGDGESGVKRAKEMFAFVEVHRWKKQGDGMPASREEAWPMMAFFARRLRSRQGVPEGAVEVG